MKPPPGGNPLDSDTIAIRPAIEPPRAPEPPFRPP